MAKGLGGSIITGISIPNSYDMLSESSSFNVINRGQQNKFRLRPTVLNEHAESSREAMAVVNATTIVGQIFKSSKDNIAEAFLTLESAAAETAIDAIEEANDAALQLVWVLTGTNLATLSSTVVSGNNGSTKSMQLMMDVLNDKWTNTFAAADFTGATLEFDHQQTKESVKATLTVSISDGVNISTIDILVAKADKNVWKHQSIPFSAFTGIANVAAITSISYSITNKNAGEFAYIDNVAVRPDPGKIMFKLWDCGATLPASGTFILSTNATQYTTLGDLGITGLQLSSITIDLLGGKNIYRIPNFVAGVAKEMSANVPLTIGNYYAITVHYVDTDVTVYGPDTAQATNYYTNGYGFSTTAENAAITVLPGANGAGAYSDLMFMITSTQPVYITEVEASFRNSSNVLTAPDVNSGSVWVIEDSNMHITHLISTEESIDSQHCEDLKTHPSYAEDGSKIEVYYNSSIDDTVTQAVMGIKYIHEHPSPNG